MSHMWKPGEKLRLVSEAHYFGPSETPGNVQVRCLTENLSALDPRRSAVYDLPMHLFGPAGNFER